MIQKFRFGTPFHTEAVVENLPISEGLPAYGAIALHLYKEDSAHETVTQNCFQEDPILSTCTPGFQFSYQMSPEDIVYGLGEANRGINKRGFQYISCCTDDPNHTEDKNSLYGAHNFLVISGRETFGLFFDYPGVITFDIGYTRQEDLTVTCENADLDLYVIEGTNAYDIVKQFRKIIGRSYIPPKFAFGYGQSRWGYKTAEDFKNVVEQYRRHHVPIDMLYMDIDYMQDYKDFTVNEENFPDFGAFVQDIKSQKVHLIPIIDAGVKIEDGYDIYEEGKDNDYFCKREDGSDFAATVWPGRTHFPDVLNPKAREWFGGKYERLISQGIDGFWNDMNEPSIFYSDEGMEELKSFLLEFTKQDSAIPSFLLNQKVLQLANSPEDYRRFYHNVDGQKIRHDKVHNLFGFNMTRAAGEAFEKIAPGRRFLLFSRSSYIGMHRYGGIWTGDNKSWWSHLLLNLKMLPSLNMCGFLYIGADLGGFGANATRDLVLRWLALGVFTPLMRNHAAAGTREQECYQFENIEDFRHVIGVRYRLLPYIYSEFMKAALNDDLYFKPLAFVYPDDERARRTEDQLMVGNEIMIAPVYTQNAAGRFVYLPEEMNFVKFLPDGTISKEVLGMGDHYVDVALNEVPLFIRKGKGIPVVDFAECVDEIDMDSAQMIGYENADYDLYEDDGISTL